MQRVHLLLILPLCALVLSGTDCVVAVRTTGLQHPGFHVTESGPGGTTTAFHHSVSIFVRFSSGVDVASISVSTVQVTRSGQVVQVNRAIDRDGLGMRLTPVQKLTPGLYAVGLTTGVRDVAGNALVEPHRYEFSVGE